VSDTAFPAERVQPAEGAPASVLEFYEEALSRRGFARDDSQYRGVRRLQRLYEEWSEYK
jgi:predicted ATPase